MTEPCNYVCCDRESDATLRFVSVAGRLSRPYGYCIEHIWYAQAFDYRDVEFVDSEGAA